MAELHTARTPSAPSRARRKGFLAFCALLMALTAVLAMAPFSATASHRSDPAPVDRARTVATADHGPALSRPNERPADGGATLARLVEAAQPVSCGAGTQPLVALTFDDGPGVFTGQTLDLLEERGMTATFFLAGKLIGVPWIDGTLVGREAELGEVGDHSWDHVSVVGLSDDELEVQIAETRRVAAEAAGGPVRLFRPPLGAHDARVRDYARSLGMLTVMWSLESGDSQGDNAVKIYRAVRERLSAGDIILLHENRGTTQRALPRILDLIERRGLRTVTVSELLTLDPPTARQLRQRTCPA